MTTDYAIFIEVARLRVPACMLWPVPDADLIALPEQDPAGCDELPRVAAWQQGRCGICNGREQDRRLDLDHSYETGLYRGYLCRGCNLQEGHSGYRRFVLWRAGWNPATLLGVHVEKINQYGYPILSEDGRRMRMMPERRAAYDAEMKAAERAAMVKIGEWLGSAPGAEVRQP